jgi:hypothetical protein
MMPTKEMQADIRGRPYFLWYVPEHQSIKLPMRYGTSLFDQANHDIKTKTKERKKK